MIYETLINIINKYEDDTFTIDDILDQSYKPILFDFSEGHLISDHTKVSKFKPYNILTSDCAFLVFNNRITLTECSCDLVKCLRLPYNDQWILNYYNQEILLFEPDGYITELCDDLEDCLPDNIMDIDESHELYIQMKLF